MSIVQNGDSVLRDTAVAVPESAFGTPALAKKLTDMVEALDAESDGVALAAPQIGLAERIFIVRYDRMVTRKSEDTEPLPAEIGVFINPEVVKVSRKKEEVDEGCLSVRGTYGKTVRHTRATVRAYDEHGVVFERGGGGLLAQAFQHEIDHLDGTLFIDHAIDLWESKRVEEHDA